MNRVPRPAFLLLHGWGCDRADMTTLSEALARSGPVAALDLPGHGTRTGSRATGITDLARAALTDAVRTFGPGSGPVVLVGHSLGGAVALEAAVRAPNAVAAVVMLDSTWAVIAPSAQVRARPLTGTGFAERLAQVTHGRDRTHRAAGARPPGPAHTDPATLAAIFADLMRWPGPHRLIACRVPVLALFAEGHAVQADAAAAVSGVQAEVVSGAPHLIQVRRPVQTARRIIGFLADTDIASGPTVPARRTCREEA